MILWWVFKKIHEEKIARDPVILHLKDVVIPVFPELETVKLMRGDSSYTMNKKKIYICTSDPNTGDIYDTNMLTYVLLHELAHVLSPDIGHTDTFMKIFMKLLERAEAAGIYDKSKPRIQNYCKKLK